MNTMYTINDFTGFTDQQKSMILEWLARKLWIAMEESSGEPDYYGKSYDPLTIDLEEKEAYSYVFNLSENDGRHNSFSSLGDLESRLMNDFIYRIKERLYGI